MMMKQKFPLLTCLALCSRLIAGEDPSSDDSPKQPVGNLEIVGEEALKGLITLSIEDKPLHEVVRIIGEQAGVEIHFPEELRSENARQSLQLADVYWKESLEVLLVQQGLGLTQLRPDLYLVTEPGNGEGQNEEEFLALLSGDFLKSYVNNMKEILRDKSWAEAQAEYDWNYYQALIDKGFTREQAFQLVLMAERKDLPETE